MPDKIKHSKQISAGTRVYYVDLKEDKTGREYISISEFQKRTRKKSRIFLHGNVPQELAAALSEVLKHYTNPQ